MKKIIRMIMITFTLLSLFGCSQKEPSVIKTYEVTDPELAFEDDELVTMVKYYEMSDGTWRTDTYTCKICGFEITFTIQPMLVKL
ncbi:MAG: hypothetical protein K2N85_10745 [Lachnospiraceae bacterium]|nr:hypothetical protein [Lachnospiraceae bacterium]